MANERLATVLTEEFCGVFGKKTLGDLTRDYYGDYGDRVNWPYALPLSLRYAGRMCSDEINGDVTSAPTLLTKLLADQNTRHKKRGITGCQSHYLGAALDSGMRKRVIAEAVEHLTLKSDFFDTIVFRGMSGALIGPTVADALGKRIAMVRKPGEECHSCLDVEGELSDRYLIIDDQISSGHTIRSIIEAMKKVNIDEPPVAVYIYAGCPWAYDNEHPWPIWYNEKRR